MIPQRDAEYLVNLVDNLRRLPSETEWVEFKVNRSNCNRSRLASIFQRWQMGLRLNGEERCIYAVGCGKRTAMPVVGTEFKPDTVKQGNEPLDNWLRRGLTPRIDFRFHEVAIDGKRVVSAGN